MSISRKNLLNFYDLYKLLLSPHLTTLCFTLEQIYKYRFLVPRPEVLILLGDLCFQPEVIPRQPFYLSAPRRALEDMGSTCAEFSPTRMKCLTLPIPKQLCEIGVSEPESQGPLYWQVD